MARQRALPLTSPWARPTTSDGNEPIASPGAIADATAHAAGERAGDHGAVDHAAGAVYNRAVSCPAVSIPAAIACALALWAAGDARAEDVTLDEARARAVAHAPDVALEAARMGLAEADLAGAGDWPNPTVAVGSASQSARLSSSVAWPLPLFGQRRAAVRAAQKDVAVARLDLAVARIEARAGASLAWLALWLAEARRAALASGTTAAREAARVAGVRFAAGSGARVDVVLAEAEVARAEADDRAAEAEVGAAGAALARWLGPGAPLALHAAGAPDLADPADLSPTSDDAVTLVRDRAAVAAAGAHAARERRERYPLIEGQLGVNLFDPGFSGPEVVVGVAVELPVFDRRAGAIARADAEARIAETQAALDADALAAAAREAERRVAAARARLDGLEREVLPRLVSASEMTRAAFAEGRLDLLRVLDADRAVRDARLDALDAKAAWQSALVELERAQGRPVPEEVPVVAPAP